MRSLWHTSSVFNRWLAFNLVGAIGIVVQMTTLFLLSSCFGLGYLLATGIAVETAVIHNFIWHERWTWADRTESFAGGVWQRLLWFHITNGAVSLAGNLLLMRFLVGELHVHYLVANGLSIALLSIANFIAGNCFVFRNTEAPLRKRR